ncbi:MAG: hypothetical protein Q8P68_05425 [Candidatus Peregrinibacteria bacterium]|nr:hypothetical protein [Candidatus Peregrinibacteria bacterium]MDZ4244368.1 hypothetical protein [Candidatus Gracilibacteria bacterium]
MEYKELQKKLKAAAPKTTLSWEQYFKKRKKKRKIILLITLVIFFIWLIIHNAKTEYNAELISVIVSNNELAKASQIIDSNLATDEFTRDQLPSDYYTNKDELIGLYAIQTIPGHAIITPEDVKRFIKADSMAIELNENEVAFTIDGKWLESKLPQLIKGDRLSVLVSNPKRGIDDTVFIVESVEVIDFVRDERNSSSNYITIKVTSDESRNLLYAKSQSLAITIVLTQ